MALTYRVDKGAALTYAELDENFRFINKQYNTVAPGVAAIDDQINEATRQANNAAASAASARASETSASVQASNSAVSASQSAASAAASDASALASDASAIASDASAAASATSAGQSAASASSAQSASLQTAADRVQTGLDVIATGLARDEAVAARDDTQELYESTVTALVAGGLFSPTYQDAINSLSSFNEGDVIAVLVDETYGGRRTYYRVQAGALSNPTIEVDFTANADALRTTTVPSMSADFIMDSYSLFESAAAGDTLGAFASGYPYEFVTADQINIVSVPTTATSPAIIGDFAVNSTHLYVATGTNAWKRILLETF